MTDNNKIPPGYEKTEETFIDPTNKKKIRVYYNAADGTRYYYEEPWSIREWIAAGDYQGYAQIIDNPI